LDSFVHDYYSVERFKIAYSGTIPTMTDKSQWPKVSLGFKLRPPKLKIGQEENKRTDSRQAMNQVQGNWKNVKYVEKLDSMILAVVFQRKGKLGNHIYSVY